MNKKHKFLTGFTLIELMVVVVIISVLASLAIPLFSKTIEKSRQAEAINMLSMMYKGYKDLIVDETLCKSGNSYNFCNGSDFNPDESDSYPDNPPGRSSTSWGALSFDNNPNHANSNLYFSYDFLKPKSGGWQDRDYLSQGDSSDGRNPPGIRPTGYDNVNMGVAWRKTRNSYGYNNQYPIDNTKWIIIDMDTGAIVKSDTYR